MCRRSPGIRDLVRADGARRRALQQRVATSSRMPRVIGPRRPSAKARVAALTRRSVNGSRTIGYATKAKPTTRYTRWRRGRPHISSSGSTRPENHWIKVDPAARDAVRRREAVRLRDALRSDAAEWSEERIRDAIDGIQVVFVGPTGKQEGLERSALWLNDLRLRPAVVINHLLLRHGLLGSDASQGGASLPDKSVLRRIVRVARERREWLVADGAVRIEDDSVERLTALLTRSRSERAPPPRAAQCTRSSTWARTRCRSRPPPRCWCRHSRTSRSTHRPRRTARGSTRHLQSPFGGLPVLLCGDNYQKPPPKSTPWFQTLVQDSLKVRDGDTAEGQGGCRSAIAAGLAVLRLA